MNSAVRLLQFSDPHLFASAQGSLRGVQTLPSLQRVLAQIELWSNHAQYAIGVHILPKHLDEKVARLQLAKLNAELTLLTEQQARYIDVALEGPYKSEHYRY